MSDVPLFLSALPNLHPAVVHFPVALLVVAVGIDLACLLLRRQRWLDRAAATLYVLGALGAGAAFLSGREAEDGLRDLAAAMQPLIAEHADWARLTLIAFAIVSLARLGILWRDRRRPEVRREPLRILVFLAAAGGLGLLVETADHGGALVYRHGLAVALPGGPELQGGAATLAPESTPGAEAGPRQNSDPSPEARLVREEDGSILWTPRHGDAQALGMILEAAPGGRIENVTVVPDDRVSVEGLPLRVSGRALLTLPGAFDDVQVEAKVDLASFTGSAGVARHVRGPGEAEVFRVSTAGEAALLYQTGGESRVLDTGTASLSGRPATLTLSGAGSHLKGMVDGVVAAHGHLKGNGPGGVGLYMDGSGVIRIIEVRVTPLAPQ